MKELIISGVPAKELVAKYGSPLYVYDENKLREQLRNYKNNFVSDKFKTKVLYASKAFQTVAMINLAAEYDIGLDVVSGGEIYTAKKSNMPVEMIYFHGNNKTTDELIFALESQISRIVCDNLMEVETLEKIARDINKSVNVMLRINVGIEAHTHEYIVTTHIDSKFGMAVESEDCKNAINIIEKSNFLNLEGFHVHIGSQIFDLTAWGLTIEKMVAYLATFEKPLSLNLGGGFGIKYTHKDKPLEVKDTVKFLVSEVEKALEKESININELIIEPGRSIVGEAGMSLYTIGYQKKTPNRHYYFVDGGMADNIRPALYEAEYDCDIANRMDEEKTETVTIAGKFCESGDILIKETKLPKAEMGDILVVYSTGAYGYSMSSEYNRALRPAVVFCKDWHTRLVVKRETYEDLLRGEEL